MIKQCNSNRKVKLLLLFKTNTLKKFEQFECFELFARFPETTYIEVIQKLNK